MKQLPIIIIASLLFPLDIFSQSNVQVNALGFFSETKGVGAEIVGNIQGPKNLSIGFGTQPMEFEEDSEVYLPVFGTVKYHYPLPKQKFFTSLDPGYRIYRSGYITYTSPDFHRNGATYLSASIMLNRPANVFSQIRQPDVSKSADDYYKKSKRQKNIGRILLGTGIVLIGSGIIIGYHQKGALTGIAAQVYISGPGIISSLVSIPFFIASGHNKRKTMNH